MNASFEVRGDPMVASLPVVVHVPHCATIIPPEVLRGIVLDPSCLQTELLRLTDWHVDGLFADIARIGGVMFVNLVSRLVVDPERFRDNSQEEMASRGMGAVYTLTSDGKPLRLLPLPPQERERLLAEHFDPYSRALEQLVSQFLARFGKCLIIDGHSFATKPLPHELDKTEPRPDICIGTDPFHTPKGLVEAAETVALHLGLATARNRPFSGTYVPMRYFGSDQRVASVMLEIRRGLYCDEATGRTSVSFKDIQASVAKLLTSIVTSWE